jgi:hypothetical protein
VSASVIFPASLEERGTYERVHRLVSNAVFLVSSPSSNGHNTSAVGPNTLRHRPKRMQLPTRRIRDRRHPLKRFDEFEDDPEARVGLERDGPGEEGEDKAGLMRRGERVRA